MTRVRRGRLTFIRAAWIGQHSTHARLHDKRPGEGAARPVRAKVWSPESFSPDRYKGSPIRLAAGLSIGADVAGRRAHTEVIERMQPDTSDESIESDDRVAGRPPNQPSRAVPAGGSGGESP